MIVVGCNRCGRVLHDAVYRPSYHGVRTQKISETIGVIDLVTCYCEDCARVICDDVGESGEVLTVSK